MNTILDELKLVLKQRDNALLKIILLNVIVFVAFGIFSVFTYLSGLEPISAMVGNQLRLPANLLTLATRPWTVLSYSFFHTDLLHILFNMLFLYWFGGIIKEYIGNNRLISMYLYGGLSGAVLFLFSYNTLPIFSQLSTTGTLQGASGSIYAIVVGAATLAPHISFNLIFLGPVRIVYIAGFYVLLSFLNLKGANAGGNFAHLGGALLGYIYIVQLRKGNDLGKPMEKVYDWFDKLFAPKPKMRVTYRQQEVKKKPVSVSDPDYMPEQDEIDLILDKINRSGYESLSKEEKQKLFKFSQK